MIGTRALPEVQRVKSTYVIGFSDALIKQERRIANSNQDLCSRRRALDDTITVNPQPKKRDHYFDLLDESPNP